MKTKNKKNSKLCKQFLFIKYFLILINYELYKISIL